MEKDSYSIKVHLKIVKARQDGAVRKYVTELYFAVSQNGTKHEIKLVSGDAFKNIFNNEWHHLVFVRSHEEQALIAYCDGKLLGKRDSNRAYMNSEVGIVFGNVMEKLRTVCWNIRRT